MAGFSKLYCIGTEGGFQGADGCGEIRGQILVGDASRQWLEPLYIRPGKPLGGVRTVVPAGPDVPDALLDAAIAFFPDLFSTCPAMDAVGKELTGEPRIDFDLGTNVPPSWAALREQARPLLKKLGIWSARLERVTF